MQDIAQIAVQVGSRVRTYREDRGITIRMLAERSGVSVGHLSMIERGKGNPSFNTIAQVSHALDLPLARLLDSTDVSSPVVRKSERRALDAHGRTGGVHELLTPSLRNTIEAIWVEEPPGYTSEDTPFEHPGEEFALILEGEHTVWLDGTPYDLSPGDSMTYASTIPHWYSNRGTTTVKALWIITPPTF